MKVDELLKKNYYTNQRLMQTLAQVMNYCKM